MMKILNKIIYLIDIVNYRIGRVVMYGIFLLVVILAWSSISKTFLVPSLWTLEMAQFALVAYYILGGPYSIQLGSNVRMDLFYGNWSVRRKAKFDIFTSLLLVFYLGVLFYGSIESLAYSLQYSERSPTAWRPYLWPIKFITSLGFVLMLLQIFSEFLKDILRIKGEKI